jgi:hypothetical protein
MRRTLSREKGLEMEWDGYWYFAAFGPPLRSHPQVGTGPIGVGEWKGNLHSRALQWAQGIAVSRAGKAWDDERR